MLPVINIGPLAVQAPGLILIIGLWVGLWVAEKNLNQRRIAPNSFNNLVLISLAGGVIGARITYALQYSDAFTRDPLSLLSLSTNLFDTKGGILFGVLIGLIYGGRKGLDLWDTLDALTPLLGVLAITFGFSNLASGTYFGISADLPWAIDLWGEKRHPTQVYQILISILILFIFWPGRTKIQKLKPGQYFLLYISASLFGFIFLTKFVQNYVTLVAGFRLEQISAWLILAFCIWGFSRLSKTEKNHDS